MQSEVEVTQADRDAAAALFAISKRQRVKRGECDTDYLVQAFARHRLAFLRDVERAGGKESNQGQPPMTTQSALLERLEAKGRYTGWYCNPDGPEAAALIRSMQERIDRLEGERDALRAKLANSIQFAGGQSPLVCGSGTARNTLDRKP